MESRLGLRRLLHWMRARAEASVPDAADAGTAFGMEMALEAERREGGDAAARDDNEAPAAAARPRPPAR